MATRPSSSAVAPAAVWRADLKSVKVMLALAQDAPLVDERVVYEPKYDGIRAVVEIEPRAGARGARIWSRLGNERTHGFPGIVRALEKFSRRLKTPVVLDGEIVALDARGAPAGFQALQRGEGEAAFIAFDVLRDGAEDVRPLPLSVRRLRLERILGNPESPLVRLSEFVPHDGRALFRRAHAEHWEGLIAKRLDSAYHSGRRTSDWRKLKIVHQQEFVIGGWTEPRGTRSYFGSLLLGYYGDEGLVHAGHTGTGFDAKELARLHRRLTPLETPTCPFVNRPKTNERAHWVRPEVVAEVKFTEWTADGKLRHPAYLGLRDDKKPETVGRETTPTLHGRALTPVGRERARVANPLAVAAPPALAPLIARLEEIERGSGGGTLVLPDRTRLTVGHLDKVFWPGLGLTKGALMRYYVAVAPYLLPAVAARPLVMRRHPNGIAGKAFYQQRAPEGVPPGVRVERVTSDEVVPRRLIGGSLITLLYMTQIAVISQDPWFSRVGTEEGADHAVLDLDPMPGVPFARVLDVARWIRDELGRLGVPNVPKTSGATGLHVYVPLPPRTSYDSARLFCEIVATRIAGAHPRMATLERAVSARGRRIYVDFMQNSRGKTLATAYSARASEWAGASTPVTWAEIDAGFAREDFTLRTLPARVAAVGDLWAALRAGPPADLRAALDRLGVSSPAGPPTRSGSGSRSPARTSAGRGARRRSTR